MTAGSADIDGLRSAAEAYATAVWKAQDEVFQSLCHDAFHMVCADDGQVWNKTGYLARVEARDAADGDPLCQIDSLEADGDMGRVKIRVGVPGVTYEDYLGFVRVDGEWKLINKLFRDVTSPVNG